MFRILITKSLFWDSVGVPDEGGQAAISADGTQLTYTPAPDFNGIEHVPYTIRDGWGGDLSRYGDLHRDRRE